VRLLFAVPFLFSGVTSVRRIHPEVAGPTLAQPLWLA
jgi:hypothetical protein